MIRVVQVSFVACWTLAIALAVSANCSSTYTPVPDPGPLADAGPPRERQGLTYNYAAHPTACAVGASCEAYADPATGQPWVSIDNWPAAFGLDGGIPVILPDGGIPIVVPDGGLPVTQGTIPWVVVTEPAGSGAPGALAVYSQFPQSLDPQGHLYVSGAGQTGFTAPVNAVAAGCVTDLGGNLHDLSCDSSGIVNVNANVQRDTILSGLSVATLGGFVTIGTSSQSTVSFGVEGTWTGTLSLTATTDGTNFFPITGRFFSGSAPVDVDAIAGPGILTFPSASLFQARLTATGPSWTGTATIVARESVLAAPTMSLLGSLPSGTNTIGAVTAPGGAALALDSTLTGGTQIANRSSVLPVFSVAPATQFSVKTTAGTHISTSITFLDTAPSGDYYVLPIAGAAGCPADGVITLVFAPVSFHHTLNSFDYINIIDGDAPASFPSLCFALSTTPPPNKTSAGSYGVFQSSVR